MQSSWLDPDGYDGDWYTYDSFVLASDTDVTEVRWRGGYIYGAMFGKAFDFSVYFFESAALDSQPLCGNPHVEDNIYLARYFVNGNAQETAAGTFGGTTMYDYRYTLSRPLHLSGGVKYWIRMLASHPSVPDWGIATGSGGNGSHFYFNAGGARFGSKSGDTAFTLYGSQSQTVVPSSVTVVLGQHTAGTVADLAVADGTDYAVCKFVVPTQQSPIVNVVVDGATTLSAASSYIFKVRAHMLNSGQFQAALEPYRFVNGVYDTGVKTAVGTTYTDFSATATPAGDYVGASGEVRARVRTWRVGPSASAAPCLGLDQAVWTLTD